MIKVGGQLLAVEQDNFTGTAGNDTINGTSGADTIDGLGGNDTITAGDGADTIDAGAGDDTINAGTGNSDNVIGGTGNDLLIINYSTSTNQVSLPYPYTIADNGTNGYNGVYYDNNVNTVTFSEIERFDITGGSGNDNLVGGKNNDTLKGGAGDDYLFGGGGTDTIDGGTGNDRLGLNLSTQTTALNISINTTGSYSLGGVTATSIEALSLTTGSGNDTFTGGALADDITAGAGNDSLTGNAGDDYLDGGTGTDTIDGGTGNDYLYGGDGNDTINGGDGADTIDAGAGDDTINAGTGNNDTVVGGTGNDLLIVNYSTSTTPIYLVSSYTITDNGYTGGYTDYNGNLINFSEIERFDITGGSGNDYLFGGKNNDTLKGGAGDDSLVGGGGTDTIDGGTGNDTLVLNLSTLTTAVTASIATGNFTSGGVTATSIEAFSLTTGSGNDTITGGAVADAITAGAGNDSLTGNAGDDYLDAGAGNDTINGGDGADTIDAGAGDDTINAGTGNNDTVVGGTGNDLLIVNYSTSTTPIYLVSSYTITDNGYTGGYTDYNGNLINFSEIERFDITGGSAGDYLLGGKNNDTLKGGAGDDSLDGGLGADTFGFGEVGFTTVASIGVDTITTFVANTDKIKLHKSTFAAITTAAGTSIGTNFISVADDTLVASQTAAIIYSRASGGLFYNADGATAGSGVNGGQFAVLPLNLTLTANDFLVVDNKINLSVAPASVTEDGTPNLVYTFTRTDITNTALTVNFTLSGTATINTDYIQTGATSLTGANGTVTFAPGATTATVTINPTADTGFEVDETVALTLATGTGYALGTTTAVTGTIVNDDNLITLAVAPASVNEDGTTNLVYTFTRPGSTTSALTVNYSVGGTATLGTDYAQTGAASFTATTGTVTFAAGATTATVTIDPTTDNIVEANETIALTLASGTGYGIGTTTAVTGTIVNDDANITLAVAPVSVNEDGTTNLVYTFTRAGFTTNALTVNYGVGGTATLGTDYAQTGAATFTATTGTVTFAAGATTATVTVNPTTDTIFEADETVALTLASGNGYSVVTTAAVTGTIVNDDTNVTLAVAPASVNEDGTPNLVYTFTRTGVTTNALTVNYGVAGTATLGTDYAQTGAATFTATTGTVTFAAGATTATVTVNPTTDTTVEANETVALTLATGTGYNVGTTTAVTGTIVNDDTNVTLAVAPASVNEDGTTNLVYTFTRTGITTNALTVNYGVGGTATLATDYTQTGAASFTATIGTVTFAAGATTATVTVDPTADVIFEANETVALTLASGAGYSVGTTTAITGTITNDDIPPAISIADLIIVEGMNGNPTQSLITISLNQASSQAISVNYATSDGTAILQGRGFANASTDYTATTGTLTFAAGQTSLTIAVPILNDNLSEYTETFKINLTTPVNATIADNQATVTITDTITASVTTILPALVENLTLIGTSAIDGTGNAGANVLTGNAANNILAGLDGNDSYLYDADLAQGKDTINETSTGGIDTLNLSLTAAAVNINLGLTTAQTVNANLQLVIPVIAIENLVGGTGNDRITGNILNNTIQGGSGDDRISGAGGNDIIFGQGGNDILNGGAGNDIFYYNGLLSGAVTASGYFGLDTISDFTSTQDKIYLSKATFTAITSAAGTAIGTNFITRPPAKVSPDRTF